MADFKIAYEELRAEEGGWVNNPHDSGGETYAGITRHYNPEWPGWSIIDNYKKKTSNIAELNQWLDSDSRLQLLVSNFYEQRYWNFGVLDSQSIANKLFSIDVNTGKGRGVKLLQESLNELGERIAVDGSLGPQTLAAIQKQKEADILTHLRAELSLYYTNLVVHNPDLQVFLKGWLKRAAD